MLLLSFLLSLVKSTLLFRIAPLAAERFARELVRLALELQSLLRPCPSAVACRLPPRLALRAFGVCRRLFHDRVNSRTEFKPGVFPQYPFPHLVVPWLCAERNSGGGQLSTLRALKHADPERIVKIHRQHDIAFVHNETLPKIVPAEMDDPEGRVTYLTCVRRLGYLPALARRALRFYSAAI